MIAVPAGMRVLVATRPIDFRKGADGLVALVSEKLGNDPFSGTVFGGWGVAQGPYDVARRRASCAPLSWASTNSARRPQTNAH